MFEHRHSRLAAVTLSLGLLAGCASTSEIDRLESELATARQAADAAMAAANEARAAAAEADRRAEAAMGAADAAQNAADTCSERCERMMQKAMSK